MMNNYCYYYDDGEHSWNLNRTDKHCVMFDWQTCNTCRYFMLFKSKHRKYNISLKMLDWENQQTVGLQRQVLCGISIEGNDHVSSFALRRFYLLPILDLVISKCALEFTSCTVPIENPGIFQGPWGALFRCSELGSLMICLWKMVFVPFAHCKSLAEGILPHCSQSGD